MFKSLAASAGALVVLVFGVVVMWKTRSGSCTASDPPQCSYSPGLFGTGVLIACIAVSLALVWVAWLRPRG